MLKGFILLLLFQLTGEVITYKFSLPIPGPVIGMVLLLFTLVLFDGSTHIEKSAQVLLPYLPLLLIPASVGIIRYADRVQHALIPILVSLLLGFFVSLWLSAKIFQRFSELKRIRS